MIYFDNINVIVSFQAYFVVTAKAPHILLVWIKDVVVAPNVNYFWDSPVWRYLNMRFSISLSIICAHI